MIEPSFIALGVSAVLGGVVAGAIILVCKGDNSEFSDENHKKFRMERVKAEINIFERLNIIEHWRGSIILSGALNPKPTAITAVQPKAKARKRPLRDRAGRYAPRR